MEITLENVDEFLLFLREEGDWVQGENIPEWVELQGVRQMLSESSSFASGDIVEVKHFHRDGLIDSALDFRLGLELQSYGDTELEADPEPAAV